MRSDTTTEWSATCCPACGFAAPAVSAVSAAPACCPGCGIWLAGPHAAELRWIAAELARLDDARCWLWARRDVLLTELVRQRDQVPVGAAAPDALDDAAVPGYAAVAGDAGVPVGAAVPAAAAVTQVASLAGPVQGRRAEMSRRTAANLLLGAGGLLVVIASAAFTAANWGSIGTAGRALILLALAVLALSAPWPLARRAMTATSESVAAVGLALTVAIAYLAQQLAPAGPAAGLGAASGACVVLASVWALYGGYAPVRAPRLAAIGLAQFPLPLAAAAVAHTLTAVALALIVTAGGDVTLAAWAGRSQRPAERLAGCVAAAAAWLAGVLLAAAGAAAGPALHESFWLSLTFMLAAVIAVRIGPAMRTWLRGAQVTAGGALIAVALALPAAAELPGGWQAAAFAAAGTAVAVVAWPRASGQPGPAEVSEVSEVSVVGEVRAGPDSGPEPGVPGSQAGYIAAGAAAVLAGAGLWAVPAACSGLPHMAALLTGIWADPAGAASPAAAAAGVPITAWHASGSLATPAVLILVSLACWWIPASRLSWRDSRSRSRSRSRSAALVVAALAAESVPVAAGVPGWAVLIALTAAAAALLGTGSVIADRELAGTASVTGLVIAGSAALWSLTRPAATITELAVLAVVAAAAAAAARTRMPAVLATAGTLAAVTGLTCAVTLASGLPAGAAAFAVLGVAVSAAGAGTLLRRVRPAHALVLDLGAGLVVVLAVVMALRRADSFSVLAAMAALLAAGAAWLRGGQRRAVALGGAVLAAIAAIIPQAGLLARALSGPFPQAPGLWRGARAAHSAGGASAVHAVVAGWPGLPLAALPLAVLVLAASAAAVVVAAGAWRGSHGTLDMIAAVLPVVAAPAVAASGLSDGVMIGLLLALALGLTAWAAASRSMAPAGAALVTASLTLAWAVAAPVPTLAVLGCLSAAYLLCAWRARLPVVRAAAAALSVLSGSALAAFAAFASGLPAWQAGLAALAGAAIGQLAAALLARAEMPGWLVAVEITGWFVVVAAVAPSLASPVHASIAVAAVAVLCLGVALRPDRRLALWAGLALGEAALCARLAAAGVRAPEPYTVPASVLLLAFGWQRSRRSGRSADLSSWITCGPGLALLLLPSLAAVWQHNGWARPLLLGLVAAGVAIAGGRARLRAPLLLGAGTAILDAAHELAPAVGQIVGLLPRWVPIAVIGLVLLGVGATYEARLRELSKLRAALTGLR